MIHSFNSGPRLSDSRGPELKLMKKTEPSHLVGCRTRTSARGDRAPTGACRA